MSDEVEKKGCYIISPEWPVSLSSGPHIVLLSLCCLPVVFICAIMYNMYLGVLTWYNVFLYFYNEKTFFHRLTVCPLLIFAFPPAIFLVMVAISLYASLQQIRWEFSMWARCARDLEGGLYARLCSKMGLQECCPYETVVIQTDDSDSIETAKENTSLQPSPQHTATRPV